MDFMNIVCRCYYGIMKVALWATRCKEPKGYDAETSMESWDEILD